MEQAKKAANIDYDQYEVERILGYRGDISQRKSMQFELLFKAGDRVWKYFCKDIYETTYFEDYCKLHPELLPLLQSKKLYDIFLQQLNKSEIKDFVPGDRAYMNLRYIGYEKYNSFNLPDHEHNTYLMEIQYGALSKKNTEINVKVLLLNKILKVKHQFVFHYGCHRNIHTDRNQILVDEAFLQAHPAVKIKL